MARALDLGDFFGIDTLDIAARLRTDMLRAAGLPEEYVMNPDRLAKLTLFGIPIRFDSALPPDEIKLVATDARHWLKAKGDPDAAGK